MAKRNDTYAARKERAREQAKKWQAELSETSHSWGEIAEATERFTRLGKRYGLTDEFKENGII